MQLLLWPGQMRPDPAKPVQDPPQHVQQAQALAHVEDGDDGQVLQAVEHGGDAGGLGSFGVNLMTLPPGKWSSQRHWHSHEDEFVYVLEGTMQMQVGGGEVLTLKEREYVLAARSIGARQWRACRWRSSCWR